MIFDDTTHELLVTNNETGTISVENGVPPPPPVPARRPLDHGFPGQREQEPEQYHG